MRVFGGVASPRSRDYFDAFPSLSRLERRLDKDGKARRALRIGVRPGVWAPPWLRAFVEVCGGKV